MIKLIIVCTYFSLLLSAMPDKEKASSFLKKFKFNPKKFINTPLAKYDKHNNLLKQGSLIKIKNIGFSENIKNVEEKIIPEKVIYQMSPFALFNKSILIDVKNSEGKTLFYNYLNKYPKGTLSTKEVINELLANNINQIYVETELEFNIFNLPVKGEPFSKPWSSYFWPLETGSITLRYSDDDFLKQIAREYLVYEDIVNIYKQPESFLALKKAKEVISLNELEKIIAETYSPSEKYDLLVGDYKFTLTNSLKELGKDYTVDGKISPLIGLNHGWAIASCIDPRPNEDSITLLSADESTKIKFWADDIKALVSLKWANSKFDTLVIGSTCNQKEYILKKDPEKGLIKESTNCNHLDAGTFHTVLTNKLMFGESFVFDSTFDPDILNQPISGYKLSFFNPRTMEVFDIDEIGQESAIKKSIENKRTFTIADDSFHRWRKKQSVYIIGIVNEISYATFSFPKKGKPYDDEIIKIIYYYDLEIDENYKIVGGLWYTNMPPDLLWTASKGSRPQSYIDIAVRQNGIFYAGDPKTLKHLGNYGYGEKSIINISSTGDKDKNDLPAPLATVVNYLLYYSNPRYY